MKGKELTFSDTSLKDPKLTWPARLILSHLKPLIATDTCTYCDPNLNQSLKNVFSFTDAELRGAWAVLQSQRYLLKDFNYAQHVYEVTLLPKAFED